MLKLRLFVIVGLLFAEVSAFSQEVPAPGKKDNVLLHPRKFYKKFFPKLSIKSNPPDSSYVKVYPNYLSLSVHLLSPFIRTDIHPGNAYAPSASKFRTNIGDILGVNAGYRFISAGFSFLMKSGIQTHDDYAKSYYRTATIKYNRGAYSFQFMYLKLKGFTDINTSNSLDHMQFIKRQDMVVKEFKFEELYNPSWKKYSYSAPFTFTQRQVRSSIGFLLKAGIYSMQLSGDSALITRRQQQYFDDFSNVNIIRTLAIRLAPGAGGNFVFFKCYYISFAVFPSYDLYLYKYLTYQNEKVKGKQTFAFVLDSKASLGYQSQRLYAGLRYEVERTQASLYNIKINNLYTYLGLELGYRLNAPRFVKKVYKETMPPGL